MSVEDQLAIQRVLAEYCQRLDDADFAGGAALFTEEGSFSFGDQTATGRRALAEWFEANQPPHRRGRHIGANAVVDLGAGGDGDRAAVSSDFLFVRHVRGVLTVEVAGRYVDRFVRVDGAWLIERRVCEVLAPPER